MTEQNLDKELARILEAAGDRQPVRVDLPHAQAATWPWQVPQVPTITLDQVPTTGTQAGS